MGLPLCAYGVSTTHRHFKGIGKYLCVYIDYGQIFYCMMNSTILHRHIDIDI